MEKHMNLRSDCTQKSDYIVSRASQAETTRWKFLNLEYLQQIAPGNNDFFSEMMKVFKTESVEFLRRMSDQFSRKDYVALAKTAHAMKPTGTYIGVNNLSKLIAVLEKEAVSGNIDSITSLIHEVEKLVAGVNAEIEEYLKAA